MNPNRVLALVLTAAFLITACSKEKKEPAGTDKAETSGKAESATETPSRVKHGTNGEVIVTLDAPTQKLMGLEISALKSAQMSPEAKAYGRVLDISPLATLVGDLNTAQAANAASQAELERLQRLAAQDNASQRALQAAQATAAHDRAQVDSAKLKLVATWGTALATRENLADLVQSISAQKAALVEIDLPAGQPLTALPTGARLFSLTDENQPIPAEFIGLSPTVDPQLQGKGFLFLVTPNSTGLVTGAAVTGLLTLPGEPKSGVLLPRAAVIRFNGAAWAYVQTGEQTFERREVTLESPLAEGWFIREGLRPGDKVVTAGAQQMLSEELKGQGTAD